MIYIRKRSVINRQGGLPPVQPAAAAGELERGPELAGHPICQGWVLSGVRPTTDLDSKDLVLYGELLNDTATTQVRGVLVVPASTPRSSRLVSQRLCVLA